MNASPTPHSHLLILASGSPQRQRLLSQYGYRFEVVAPGEDAERDNGEQESVEERVARLARQKALAVRIQIANTPLAAEADSIVACDTLAECQGEILGKPRDAAHAREMLRMLRGQVHTVHSGLCIWPLSNATASVRVARSTLRMDNLSDAQIEEYLASGLWQGKAGAFGYQDRAGWLHLIDGSESNVVGLPLELLAEMLDGRT